MNFTKLLLVGIGGFAGSIVRYVTVRSVDLSTGSAFPYGTLTVNVVGSFLLGCIFGWFARSMEASENIRLLLITGFCGGFTTFSAFAFENLNLIQQRNFSIVLIYVISSLVLGVLATAAGVWFTRSV